jgi:hypothetical protein
MPGLKVVIRWRRSHPDFAGALKIAKRFGRRVRGAGRRRCTPELTEAIGMHIVHGGTMLSATQAIPDAPHEATLYEWMKREPDFARAIGIAREMRDDRLADRALDISQRTMPSTLEADRAQVMGIRKRLGSLSSGRKART